MGTKLTDVDHEVTNSYSKAKTTKSGRIGLSNLGETLLSKMRNKSASKLKKIIVSISLG